MSDTDPPDTPERIVSDLLGADAADSAVAYADAVERIARGFRTAEAVQDQLAEEAA